MRRHEDAPTRRCADTKMRPRARAAALQPLAERGDPRPAWWQGRCRYWGRLALLPDPADDEHPMTPHPTPGSDSPVGDVTAYDRNMTAEDALVHDTLCALQAPTGLVRLTEMIAAAGIRTLRGAAFHPPEVKRVLERLLAGGHVPRDAQGRVRAAAPHGPARFARDDARPAARQGLVRCLAQAGALRPGLLARLPGRGAAGRSDAPGDLSAVVRSNDLERLGTLAYSFTHLWSGALRRAVLQPFDAAPVLPSRTPALQSQLADRMMAVLSGFAETQVQPLEAWLLAQRGKAPSRVSPSTRLRLAETLLYRADLAGGAQAVHQRRQRSRRAATGGFRHGRGPLGRRRAALRSRLQDGRCRTGAAQEPGLAVHRLDLRDGAAGAAHAGGLEQGAQVRRFGSRQARRRRPLRLLGRVGRRHRPAAGRRAESPWALPTGAARAFGHAVAAVPAPPAAGGLAARRRGQAGRVARTCRAAGAAVRRRRHGLAGAPGAPRCGLAAGRGTGAGRCRHALLHRGGPGQLARGAGVDPGAGRHGGGRAAHRRPPARRTG